MHVLIVEDNPAFKRIIELKLSSFLPELNTYSFSTVTQAEKYLQSEHPELDLALLDEHLPDGLGSSLLKNNALLDVPTLMLSSDSSPNTVSNSIEAGAAFFIDKEQLRESLFQPLVKSLITRGKIQKELTNARSQAIKLNTIRTLVSTLRHEINNPLGAVFGATYIIRTATNSTNEQIEAANLVEKSGKRIKFVLDQLCNTIEVTQAQKGTQNVFQIPGDKKWE